MNKIISYYSRLDKNDKKSSNINDTKALLLTDKNDSNYNPLKNNIIDRDEPERLSKVTRDILYECSLDKNDKFSSTNDFCKKKINEKDDYDLMDCGDSKTVKTKNTYQ